jgi:hypothetical protein
MRVIALIEESDTIRRILAHLGLWASRKISGGERAPPEQAKSQDGSRPQTIPLTYDPVSDIT